MVPTSNKEAKLTKLLWQCPEPTSRPWLNPVLKVAPILFTTAPQTARQNTSAKISVFSNEESESEALQMITVPYLPREELADLAREPKLLKFKHTDSPSTFLPLLNTSDMCSNQ